MTSRMLMSPPPIERPLNGMCSALGVREGPFELFKGYDGGESRYNHFHVSFSSLSERPENGVIGALKF